MQPLFWAANKSIAVYVLESFCQLKRVVQDGPSAMTNIAMLAILDTYEYFKKNMCDIARTYLISLLE